MNDTYIKSLGIIFNAMFPPDDGAFEDKEAEWLEKIVSQKHDALSDKPKPTDYMSCHNYEITFDNYRGQ